MPDRPKACTHPQLQHKLSTVTARLSDGQLAHAGVLEVRCATCGIPFFFDPAHTGVSPTRQEASFILRPSVFAPPPEAAVPPAELVVPPETPEA